MKPMTEAEMRLWDETRLRGRHRFLLQNIRRSGWLFVGGVVVELGWWFCTRQALDPIWKIAAKWAVVAVAAGAFGGLVEWNTNEQRYNDSQSNETRR
jgi:hypothetical protein